jgi:2-methylcitrate dehydratase PrpD
MTDQEVSSSDILARFVSSTEEIPPSVYRASARTVANVVALMVGASRSEAVMVTKAALGVESFPAQATLWGTSSRTSMPIAALVGGIGAHVEDFDDTHLDTVVHPGAAVVPAALAVGEHLGATYGTVVEASALGIEVALRVAIALGKDHFDRGWHVTGTFGHIGAALACSRLLGLDPLETRNALGLACTEAAGLQVAFGTMTKSFHPGKAAYDGVEAAFLAGRGFTAAWRPIEGRRGLGPVASSMFDEELMTLELGHRWEVEDNAFKPYACGIVSHPVIDAGVLLREEGVSSNEVASVMLRTNPVVLDVMGVKEPLDGLQSKFSVYHCFAVGLLDGAGGVEQFSTPRVLSPDVVELRRKVSVQLDPTVERDACTAEVVLLSGERRVCHVEHATASKARPMTEAQLTRKMELLMAPVLGDERAVVATSVLLGPGGSVDLTALIELCGSNR